jgi:tetratricopeptide (TPR) repeat protein
LGEKEEALELAGQRLEQSQQSFDQALQAVDQMLARVGDERLVDVPQMRMVRRELLEDAVRFYSTLRQQDPGNHTVRYRMAFAQISLGTVIVRLEGKKPEAEAHYHAAIATLTDLVEGFPGESEYQLALASAYFHLGGRAIISHEERITAHRKAIALYKQLSTTHPRADLYRWGMARSHQEISRQRNLLGQHSDAAALARQVIDSFPASESGGLNIHGAAYHQLATAQKSMGLFEQADTACQNAIRLQREFLQDVPPHSDDQRWLGVSLNLRGKLLLQLERYDQAEQCCREAADIWKLLMQSYKNTHAAQGHLDNAQATLIDILMVTGQTEALDRLFRDFDPRTSNEYVVRGRLYEHIKEFDKALADYGKAIEIEPDYLKARERRGNLYLDRGQYEVAISDFSKCIELSPKAHIYKRRGLTHFHLGNYSQSLADIAKAVELKHEDTSNLTWIPTTLVAACPDESFRNGMLELSAKTIELTNGSTGTYAARGSLHAAIGNYDEARLDFQKAITPDNDSYYAHYQHALLCLWTNDKLAYRQASSDFLEQFSESDEASQTHFVAWTCALAPSAVSDYATVLALAQVAVESDPHNQQYLGGLGAVQMRAGEYEQALASLDQAAGSDESSNTSSAYIAYFRAMTLNHLDRKDDARQSLARANQLADKELSDAASPTAWNRKLTLQLLRKEADSLIGNADTETSQPTEATFTIVSER